MIYYRIVKKIYQRAARKMCLDCENFIKRGAEILDLGCGSGIAGNEFRNFFEARVTGIDIRDWRIEKKPFQIFDGVQIPFSDNSFDIVLISYVLHHAKYPEALLREAKRVARGKIVIYEDLPEGFFSKIYCKLHQLSFDNLFGNPAKTSFKKAKDWEKIFKELGLKVIFKKRKQNFPIKKELYILEI